MSPFLAGAPPTGGGGAAATAASGRRLRQAVGMDGFGPASYGDTFADVYDQWYDRPADRVAVVEHLAELAALVLAPGEAGSGPPILELGIGTGRLAIPLAERGLEVWGVDASDAMLARLRAKPGGEGVHTVLGDMAHLDLGGLRFGLVFVAYNTLFNLIDADDQARCLRGVADHLLPGGRFVIEAFVPREEPMPRSGVVEVARLERDQVVLVVTRAGPADQVVEGQHVEISERGVRLRPWQIRFLRPDQLDDLAGAVGLRLESRSAGWRGEPFDDSSTSHVSVYVAGEVG
jgi:SAM-dependent methyltransferase